MLELEKRKHKNDSENVDRKESKVTDYLKSREFQLINRIKYLEVDLLGDLSRLEHEQLKNGKYLG